MTFTNLKKRVASLLGYVDSDGAIIASKDITETDIGNWINDRYKDLVTMVANQYPEDYEEAAKANFYKATSTITSISSTTLTIDDANFNTGMVGDRVYNSTRENYEVIGSYTSTTVVTLDEAPTDWEAGDTVYILGHEFALGGDATDARVIRWVGVKYASDDSYYRTVRLRDQNDLLQTGNEIYSEGYPRGYITTTDVYDSDLEAYVPTTTIGILPEATESVANGIKLRYLEIPAALSDDDSVPRLPLGSHPVLVLGAAADGFRKLLNVKQANDYERKYEIKRIETVNNYALTRSGGAVQVRPPRKVSQIMRREI